MPGAAPRRRGRRLVAAGIVLLVLAIGAAAICAVRLVATNAALADAQRTTATAVEHAWRSPAEPAVAVPLPAGAIGLLRVPRFGAGYVRVIEEGTTDRVLDSGAIGHYAGTAAPGELGNVALAGHREADGAALLQITALRPGDAITLETRTRVFTYRVTGSAQIDPTAVGAIAPVPWHPGATPSERLLTLQSCTPPLIDTWRYAVWARLVSAVRR